MSNTTFYTRNDISAVETKLNTEQLKHILEPTPTEHVKKRKGKGGEVWSYVTTAYTQKILNMIAGFDWDFEILEFEYNKFAKQCIVRGKLTIRFNGVVIVKQQFGRCDVKLKKHHKEKIWKFLPPETQAYWNGLVEEIDGLTYKGVALYDYYQAEFKRQRDVPLDLGNDFKGAASDALKKCASMIGLFSDVYAPQEYKAVTILTDDEVELDTKKREIFAIIKELSDNSEILQRCKDASEQKKFTNEFANDILDELKNFKSNEDA